jgi:ABC-type transporter Mla subunit MlaD
MASEQTRNTIVGLTVILAIAVFVVGLSYLNVLPRFFGPKTYKVQVQVANAGGVSAGTRVTLNGVQIGAVKTVATVTNTGAPPATMERAERRLGATFASVMLDINEDQNIPEDSFAAVGGPSIGIGNATVAITPPEISTGKFLPKDGSAVLRGGPPDSGLLPKEVFADLNALKNNLTMVGDEIAQVARDLHILLSMREIGPDGKPVPTVPGKPAENIFTLVVKLNKSVDYINGILADPKLPENISAVMRNLAESSATLKKVLEEVNSSFGVAAGKIGGAADAFTNTMKNADPAIANIGSAAKSAERTLDAAQGKIAQIADDLSKTLKTLDAAIVAISAGDGTTGKLAKDPKLYDGLVDLTNSLKATTEELNKLIHQWKNDGVPLKVNIGGGGK